MAILTLLSSGALFFFFLTSSLVLVVGGGHGEGFNWIYVLTHYPALPISLILTVYAFFLSMGMFTLRTKSVWIASIVFWLVLMAFFFAWAYNIWSIIGLYHENGGWYLTYAWQYAAIAATLLPFINGIGSIAYFLKHRVGEYFHV